MGFEGRTARIVAQEFLEPLKVDGEVINKKVDEIDIHGKNISLWYDLDGERIRHETDIELLDLENLVEWIDNQ